jgi:hypothetical protein
MLSMAAQTLFAQVGPGLTVSVSYVEVYNESVIDLLDPQSGLTLGPGARLATLRIREDQLRGPVVEGCRSTVVTSAHALDSVLAQGNAVRRTADTDMSPHSSRSHTVFTIAVRGAAAADESTLTFVDLAGTGQGGASASRLEGRVKPANRNGRKPPQTQLLGIVGINKSLAALGTVVLALASQPSRAAGKGEGSASGGAGRGQGQGGKGARRAHVHVPYRSSQLTWLLKTVFSGNCKAVVVASVSPSILHYEETVATLKWAERVNQIKKRISRQHLRLTLQERVAIAEDSNGNANSDTDLDLDLVHQEQQQQLATAAAAAAAAVAAATAAAAAAAAAAAVATDDEAVPRLQRVSMTEFNAETVQALVRDELTAIQHAHDAELAELRATVATLQTVVDQAVQKEAAAAAAVASLEQRAALVGGAFNPPPLPTFPLSHLPTTPLPTGSVWLGVACCVLHVVCVACGVRRAACSVRRAVCGVRRVVCCVRRTACGMLIRLCLNQRTNPRTT